MSDKPRTWTVREKAGGIASILVADPAEDLLSVIELEPVLDLLECLEAYPPSVALNDDEANRYDVAEATRKAILREHGRPRN